MSNTLVMMYSQKSDNIKIGPIHKDLEKPFLECFVNYIKSIKNEIDNFEAKPLIGLERPSMYCWKTDIDHYYENLIKYRPKFVYDKEEFYIDRIKISNKPFFSSYQKPTYNNVWNTCRNDKPLTEPCTCEEDEEDEDNDKDFSETNRTYLPVSSILKIDFTGDYISQASDDVFPNDFIIKYAGEQFGWKMLFCYQQKELNISMIISPLRYITNKRIVSYTFQNLGKMFPNIEENIGMKHLCWKPDNLWFDDDVLIVLKNTLITNQSQLKYKNWNFELIDTIFCETDTYDFCGGYHKACKIKTKEWAIQNFPLKSHFRDKFIYSCTPEWYLQFQIGQCNNNGSTLRFILKFV